MKSYLYLTKKYIKSYPKRCIGIVLCISLFLFAFLTILWYSNSFKYSLVENYKIEEGGVYESIQFYVDQENFREKESQLVEEKAGIISGIWEVKSKSPSDIWIGNVNDNVSTLLSLHFESGKMPKSENEIAIEKGTYDILGLKSKIGDKVELEIKNSDGNTEKKSFILTGIIKNFSNKIKLHYDYQSEKLLFPSILTTNSKASPKYIHIVAAENSFLIRNISSKSVYYNDSQQMISSKMVANNLILMPVKIFFVLTTIMGIISISLYFFKEQERYLNLLRCIGFSKKKSRKLLLIQGFFIWLSSLIISSVASILVLLLLQFISSFSSQYLFLNLSILDLIIVALLSVVLIFISFNILLARFYKNAPLREAIYVSKKQIKSQTKLKRCWHKAYGRRYKLQNFTCVMLVMFCVGMSIFGSFVPLFNARGSSFDADNPEYFRQNADYSLQMMGGGSSAKIYYINLPVGCGVSHKIANEIASDKRINVLEASVSNLFVPFFLTSQNPDNKLLYKYVVEAKKNEYNYIFQHKRTNEMIKLAGGDSSKDSLVELSVKWQSYDSVLNNINEFANGKIDEKNYKSGIEIIAPDYLCSVGDEFTMVIPIADAEATEQNIEEHIKFKVAKVKVAATYSKEQYNSDELIISTEYLFSIYPDLNYENIILENLDHNDSVWVNELENNLENLEGISVGVRYDNYAKMQREFYDQVNLETLQIIVSVFIFIVIILIAIVFSSYVQVRSNLKSYIMMRAIGARIETVQKLIINEINRTLTTGIILGTILGGAVVVFFSILGSNIKLWDIYLFYVVPVFIATVILLYFGSRIAVKRAVRSMINQNIIEKLNTVE